MQEFIDEKDERILELEEIRKQLEALSYKKDIEIRNVINQKQESSAIKMDPIGKMQESMDRLQSL